MKLQTYNRRNEKKEIVGVYFTTDETKPSSQCFTDTYSYVYARKLQESVGDVMGFYTLEFMLDQASQEKKENDKNKSG